jgi:anti-anti-sigma factor
MTCRIHAESAGIFRLLRLEGSLFSPVHQIEFRKAVQTLCEQKERTAVAIDTSELLLIGSCCLAAIIEAAMVLHKDGLSVVLLDDRSSALDVFDVVSIQTILPVYPTLEEARKALAR